MHVLQTKWSNKEILECQSKRPAHLQTDVQNVSDLEWGILQKKSKRSCSQRSQIWICIILLFLLLFSGFLFVLLSLLNCLNVFVVYDCIYSRQCSFQTLQRTLMFCVWYNINLLLTSCLQSFWCSKPQLFFKLCTKLYLFLFIFQKQRGALL